jgi:hypothetical protein
VWGCGAGDKDGSRHEMAWEMDGQAQPCAGLGGPGLQPSLPSLQVGRKTTSTTATQKLNLPSTAHATATGLRCTAQARTTSNQDCPPTTSKSSSSSTPTFPSSTKADTPGSSSLPTETRVLRHLGGKILRHQAGTCGTARLRISTSPAGHYGVTSLECHTVAPSLVGSWPEAGPGLWSAAAGEFLHISVILCHSARTRMRSYCSILTLAGQHLTAPSESESWQTQ